MRNMKYRADTAEIMDDFGLDTEALKGSLNEIAWINRVLGGNRPVLQAVRQLWKKAPAGKVVSIADMGCGNGDMLRAVAAMARKEKIHVHLYGLDANPATIAYAAQLSEAYPEITYVCCDILQEDLTAPQYDIVLLTLTLHHFTDNAIPLLLERLYLHVRRGIIINDLQRSAWAYRLFTLLCRLAGLGEMSANDGKISIMRGFKRKELEHFSAVLQPARDSIRWKWAFRYQWIIYRQ